MIVKFYEILKKKLDQNKFFLLYGNNSGLIRDTLKKIIKSKMSNNIFNYDEIDIIKNPKNFGENVNNKSFFDDEKIIIISRATDKIFKTIEEAVEKNLDDVVIILTSGILEKKSKLRNFFEKNKNTICVPFYEDNLQTLSLLAQNFFKEKKISISQLNINLIIERCSGDRINLNNELEKIHNFSIEKKSINTEDILKLTNLSENFDVAELVDNSLAMNKKKTLYILNENSFTGEDSVMIIRIFLNKLKRLLKLQSEIKIKKNVENTISAHRPPIFWKDKDIIKRQMQIWSLEKIQKLMIKVNNIELFVKKYPANSINVVTDFILEQTLEAKN